MRARRTDPVAVPPDTPLPPNPNPSEFEVMRYVPAVLEQCSLIGSGCCIAVRVGGKGRRL